jgi:hypothetical protein
MVVPHAPVVLLRCVALRCFIKIREIYPGKQQQAGKQASNCRRKGEKTGKILQITV